MAVQNRKKAGPTKKERVVGAAGKLFLDEGFGTTSMDAIAREAGVSKATVYSHFADKETLFAEIMERMCREVGGEPLPDRLTGSPQAVLERAAVFGIQRLLRSLERQILQRVVAESGHFPSLGRTFWSSGPGRLQAVVADYLAEQHRRGTLVVPDPRRAAATFIRWTASSHLLPVLLGATPPPSDGELERDVRELVSAFLGTLKSKAR